jgi:hypothetical protein
MTSLRFNDEMKNDFAARAASMNAHRTLRSWRVAPSSKPRGGEVISSSVEKG